MSHEIEVVRPMGNRLGESPLWHGPERALYWVDVQAPAIHRLVEGGEVETWPMPRLVGSLAVRSRGGLVAALKNGFCTVDLATGETAFIVDPEPERPDNVLNDGKCDRRGRFWCGSRDGALKDPNGALHRLDPDLSCRSMDEGFIVSNGLAWSPDDRTMYFADSRAETVFAYDFDVDDGAIRNRRVFFSTREIEGRCDGATVDAEGFYWCALVHGGAVARFDPGGRLDRLIPMPVRHPTMCTFGGENLDVLYVTSATSMLTDEERKAQPLAGSLFAIRGLGVRGLPETPFAG
ncbi:SMP-30/gluconolactonase/LRE family protein [Salinarimonas soli]|uniref:Regucalcin n=1 Tax=Salinarimonas soli TaxID=1638099 RepID=A0A5B2V8X8_9HYPH|nr:SMP-30/gluconolactonase/LRE family protein [Salinarimonas soli]KAA2235208.1 SMP-30/gluconolactonase/LRE family protein [Salinarimonas soli]